MKLRFRIMKSWLCVLMALSSAQLMVGVAATWGATPEPPAASVPAPPGGIVVTPGNGKIVLTWNAASGATSYHVKRSTKSGGPYTEIAAPWWHGYTNVGLSNGTRYYYVISSVNSAGQSANSGQFSGIPSNAAQAPSTPGGLNAAPGDGKVGLTWAAPSSATSYKIKRASSSGGPFTQIATSTFAGYTNVGLQNGTTYYFAVSAVNSGGESANSAAVGAKPVAPSSAVTSVSVSPATASSMTSGTLPFQATVQGTTTNKSVTWKVVLGQINASGLYTAPSKAGTDTVTAVSNADPTKSDSTVVTVTTAAPPPTHSVLLSWDASNSTVAGYNVYRSTVSGSGFTKLNLSLITTLTYTDTTVQNGTTYFYVARAVDSSGNESVDSTQASATIP
jgi:fibronectin type 3 domain-containing protein